MTASERALRLLLAAGYHGELDGPPAPCRVHDECRGLLCDAETAHQIAMECAEAHGCPDRPTYATEWSAALVASLPWGPIPGTHGRVRVRDYRHHAYGHVRDVCLDRVAVVRVVPVCREGVRFGRVFLLSESEERRIVREARAWRRADEMARARMRERVDAAIRAGEPVAFLDGQQGGRFTLPGHDDGPWVSAHGACRRLGISSDLPMTSLLYEEDIAWDGWQWRLWADLEAERQEDALADHYESRLGVAS